MRKIKYKKMAVNKLEQIKDLWVEIPHKTNFIKECATKFNRSAGSLRNHWFGAFWSIPIDEQGKVLRFMKSHIKNQK